MRSGIKKAGHSGVKEVNVSCSQVKLDRLCGTFVTCETWSYLFHPTQAQMLTLNITSLAFVLKLSMIYTYMCLFRCLTRVLLKTNKLYFLDLYFRHIF